MQLDSRAEAYYLSNPRNGNSTAASITEPVTTLIQPTGDGTINLVSGGQSPGALKIVPFGAGASGNAFTMAVYGWTPTQGNNETNPMKQPAWDAILLASYTCTLCTLAGVAGSDVDNTNLFCGTIALIKGNDKYSSEIISPTGNQKAHVTVDMKGSWIAEIRFAIGTATSCNALCQRI